MSDLSADIKNLQNALSSPKSGTVVTLYHGYADMDFLLPEGKEISITLVRRVTVTDVIGGIAAFLVEQDDGTMLVVPPSYRFMTFKVLEVT